MLLAGIDSRWPDKKELIEFIRNPEEVRKRNAHIRELQKEFGLSHKPFPELTDKEIQSILDYIKWEEQQRE